MRSRTTRRGKTIDVTTALADHLANLKTRNERTQYRLEFPTAVSANATAYEARFSRSGFGIALFYLID